MYGKLWILFLVCLCQIQQGKTGFLLISRSTLQEPTFQPLPAKLTLPSSPSGDRCVSKTETRLQQPCTEFAGLLARHGNAIHQRSRSGNPQKCHVCEKNAAFSRPVFLGTPVPVNIATVETQQQIYTPSNIAPARRPSQNEMSSSNHPFSGATLVSGRIVD